jgi:hypothetical protein
MLFQFSLNHGGVEMIAKQKVSKGKILATIFLIIEMFNFPASAQQQPIDQQVLQISAANQTQAIFNNSSPADQITIIGLLPGVIKRFKVNPVTTLPGWLNTVVTQGLNSSNADVAKATISQIGNLQMVSLADNLISIYSNSGNSDVRVRVIRSLGDMASSKAISLLKSIIDTYVLCPETDEAIISARKMCAASLASDISAYCSNLDSRINSGEFISPKTMPLASPDESLMNAKGTLQVIANGSCGQ